VHTTSLTLLERLRTPGDQQAWLRFVRLYTPLLYHWARRAGLVGQDVEDLVQDVFELLLRKLPEFRYEQGGSFRNWLRVVALNKWRERSRRQLGPLRKPGALATANLDQVAAPVADIPLDAFEEAEYRRQLVQRALQLIEPEFSPAAWTAFQQHVVAGHDAGAVAKALGIRVGTVYAAKSRVLTRLRRELDGLIE
jgi:RNA polymerase sigma-70 factor (ECF subfamily)